MAKFYIVLLILIVTYTLAFDLLMSGGYTFVEKRGWNLKFGFIQQPFEADVGVSFDFESEPRKMCFDVSVMFPVFDFSLFRAGAMLVYTRDNYEEDTWKEFAGIGALVQTETEDFTLRFGMLYPVNEEIDVNRDLSFELRYYLKPPRGLVFKDKLFVELIYHAGFFRFGLGLIEPVP